MKIDEPKARGYFIFLAFLVISLFFIVPQYIAYFKAEKGIEISLKARNKEQRLPRELLKDVDVNTKIYINENTVAEVNATKGWGWYFFFHETLEYILLFVALWLFIKLKISLETANSFETETARRMRKLAWSLIVMGGITYIHKYVLNFIVLKEMGLAEYKHDEYAFGWLIVVGVLLLYFSKFHDKGVQLQQENELTI